MAKVTSMERAYAGPTLPTTGRLYLPASSTHSSSRRSSLSAGYRCTIECRPKGTTQSPLPIPTKGVPQLDRRRLVQRPLGARPAAS